MSQVSDAGPQADLGACEALGCRAPSRCKAGPPARCACPEGYRDVNGDGRRCEDIDECAAGLAHCDRRAVCTNLPGGFSCRCASPAYQGDGTQCNCAANYTINSDGLCLANAGQPCTDNLDCVDGHCEGGTCCAHACSDPGECHTREGASCSDGQTCTYPLAADGSACDDGLACTLDSSCEGGSCIPGTRLLDCDDGNPCTDDSCQEPLGCRNRNNENHCDDHNPCTLNDICRAGTCTGAIKDCSDQTDSCNVGVCDPETGRCSKVPTSTTAACDDGDACTTKDACSAGTCVGSGNVCGPNAISCTDGSCTCASEFVAEHGVCVPVDNECASPNACSSNADCFDPSNASADVTCTCKPGYVGDGKTCTAIEPCKDNPCGDGRGSCTPLPDGQHLCSCASGYRAQQGTCVCDLSGTFAARVTLELEWAEIPDQVEGGRDFTYSYAIERHTYDAQDNLTLELTSCGSTSLDICGLGFAPVLASEAYAEFVPRETWDQPSVPTDRATVKLSGALPGATFRTENIASLLGIRLSNPLGTWPQSRRDIAGSPEFDGTAVNGALFLDHDNDGIIGMTSYAVPPGGIRADGVPPDPINDFGALSADCPRAGGMHSPYAYWPAPSTGVSPTPVRITRFYSASRVISAYNGKIDSCDQISGDVTGPDDGKMQLDARIAGCVRTFGAAETACDSSTIDFLDSDRPNRTVVSARFKAERMPQTGPVTCEMVRAMPFD